MRSSCIVSSSSLQPRAFSGAVADLVSRQMNRFIASLAVPALLTACSILPTEHQLVGTWTRPAKEKTVNDGLTITRSYSKQMVDLTLRPDHTFVWSLHGGRPTDFGRWHLSGRYLISEFSNRGKSRKTGYPYRDRIIKLTPQELVYVQGEDAPGEEVHLTRRSSEPLAAPRSRLR
jgi:hypothetical protein